MNGREEKRRDRGGLREGEEGADEGKVKRWTCYIFCFEDGQAKGNLLGLDQIIINCVFHGSGGLLASYNYRKI